MVGGAGRLLEIRIAVEATPTAKLITATATGSRSFLMLT
jgi:hypothetical protein